MWTAERNKKMDVLIMILGILMVLCGGSCMFTPLRTFLASGYALMVLLALTTGILIGAYFIVSRINMIFCRRKTQITNMLYEYGCGR